MTWHVRLNLQLCTAKKECKINFISTLSQANNLIFIFYGGTFIIFLLKYLTFQMIIEMYITCAVGKQRE